MPIEGTPVQAWFDAVSRYFSPYDVNPLNINPLKDLIERFVDFDAVRAERDAALHLGDQCADRPPAHFSAREDHRRCDHGVGLPAVLFRAVEIDGVPYWDGGYLGNPVIFPFFRTTETEDVLVVQINPVVRTATPQTSQEIMNRINEITFNSSLIGEYRAIDFVPG